MEGKRKIRDLKILLLIKLFIMLTPLIRKILFGNFMINSFFNFLSLASKKNSFSNGFNQ